MRLSKLVLASVAGAWVVGVVATCAFAQQAPPAEGDEAALIAVLQSDVMLYDKAKACQMLAVIGTKKCVPVLAALLPDEKLSHYARFGLEPIPDPSVDEALRAALGKVEGGLLVGVINSIGMRRDAEAIGDLKRLMGGSDAEVAASAAAALGRIATPEAVEILVAEAGKPAVAAACLTAADLLLAGGKNAEAAAVYDAVGAVDLPKHLEIAALYGAIRARGAEGLPLAVECLRSDDTDVFRVGLAMAQQLPGEAVTKALVDELPKLAPPPGESPKTLAVVKAEYGAEDKWIDVTDKVAAAVRGNMLTVTASNALAGDPIHGVVKQLKLVYTLDGEEHTVTIAEGETFDLQSDGPQDPRQALVIYVLGDRGDRAALPVVLEVAKSASGEARLAAVRVLAGLGDASAVPVLLATAVEAQGELARAARDSLADLSGEDVDSTLVAMLEKAEADELGVLIDLVGVRGIGAAVPTLVKLADGADEGVRAAAVGALGLTVGPDGFPGLIDRLIRAKTPEAAATAKEALRKACLRSPDREAYADLLIRAMPRATTSAKCDLLDLLGVVGGAKALEGVADAARSGNDELEDAATRVLGGWMSPDAGPVLLELAKSGTEKYRIRALRGYIRIARQLDVPTDERIAMCRAALEVATRDDERALVLEVLGRNPTPESIELALTLAEKIVATQKDAVAAAMRAAVKATQDAELVARARKLLRKSQQ